MTKLKNEKDIEEQNQPAPVIRESVLMPITKDQIFAEFISFRHLSDNNEHLAICFGSWRNQAAPMVRIHSECLIGDLFLSAKCDCGTQLEEGIQLLSKIGGIILYLREEGRGLGLYNRLDTYALQNEGVDNHFAGSLLQFKENLRSYQPAAEMLEALGAKNIKLLTNNPVKATQLERFGIKIKEIRSTGNSRKPILWTLLDAPVQKCYQNSF
jgi:GTP cyclohydrolase II